MKSAVTLIIQQFTSQVFTYWSVLRVFFVFCFSLVETNEHAVFCWHAIHHKPSALTWR